MFIRLANLGHYLCCLIPAPTWAGGSGAGNGQTPEFADRAAFDGISRKVLLIPRAVESSSRMVGIGRSIGAPRPTSVTHHGELSVWKRVLSACAIQNIGATLLRSALPGHMLKIAVNPDSSPTNTLDLEVSRLGL